MVRLGRLQGLRCEERDGRVLLVSGGAAMMAANLLKIILIIAASLGVWWVIQYFPPILRALGILATVPLAWYGIVSGVAAMRRVVVLEFDPRTRGMRSASGARFEEVQGIIAEEFRGKNGAECFRIWVDERGSDVFRSAAESYRMRLPEGVAGRFCEAAGIGLRVKRVESR